MAIYLTSFFVTKNAANKYRADYKKILLVKALHQISRKRKLPYFSRSSSFAVPFPAVAKRVATSNLVETNRRSVGDDDDNKPMGSRSREIGASRGSPCRVPFPDGTSIGIMRGSAAMRREIRTGRPGEFNDLTTLASSGDRWSRTPGANSHPWLEARGPVASAVGRVLLSNHHVSPSRRCCPMVLLFTSCHGIARPDTLPPPRRLPDVSRIRAVTHDRRAGLCIHYVRLDRKTRSQILRILIFNNENLG